MSYPFKKGPKKRRVKIPTGNKKVRNAKSIDYKGIKFKSGLEVYCYKYGKEELNLPLQYESFKTTLFEGPRLEGYLYQPNKDKVIELDPTKLRDITYSPDFHFFTESKVLVVVECKGNPNDAYPLKKKMFLKIMNEKYGKNFYFFEPHSQYQIRQCFDVIKTIK
jgi:hypothetical protein